MAELPLDDPRWCPMQTAIELHEQRTGGARLAIIDLEQGMANGKLRCMRRLAWGAGAGKRGHVPAEFWTTPERHYYLPPGPDDEWVFYVWRPDLDKLLPAASAPADNDYPPPVKPGPKPFADWPTLVAQWLIEVAVDDKQRLQNVDALVVEVQKFLDDEIKWSPSDNKVLRAKIRELLKRVHR